MVGLEFVIPRAFLAPETEIQVFLPRRVEIIQRRANALRISPLEWNIDNLYVTLAGVRSRGEA